MIDCSNSSTDSILANGGKGSAMSTPLAEPHFGFRKFQ
jgi:hypothetical protein